MKTSETDARLMKRVRKKTGLSQEEFARRTGYGAKTRISEIENGKENMSGPAIMLMRYIDHFGLIEQGKNK